MKLVILFLLAIANLTLAQSSNSTNTSTTTTSPNNPRTNTPTRLEVATQCAKENGADPAELAKPNVIFRKLFKGHDYRCWSTCFYTKLDYINDKGAGNAKKLKDRYMVTNDASVTAAITYCAEKNKDKEDKCDKIHATMVCLHKALKS